MYVLKSEFFDDPKHVEVFRSKNFLRSSKISNISSFNSWSIPPPGVISSTSLSSFSEESDSAIREKRKSFKFLFNFFRFVFCIYFYFFSVSLIVFFVMRNLYLHHLFPSFFVKYPCTIVLSKNVGHDSIMCLLLVHWQLKNLREFFVKIQFFHLLDLFLKRSKNLN